MMVNTCMWFIVYQAEGVLLACIPMPFYNDYIYIAVNVSLPGTTVMS